MRSFDFEKEYSKLLTPDIVSYIAQIHEYRGRYSADNVQKELLSELLEIARIQSTEASNRIEGIITTDDRRRINTRRARGLFFRISVGQASRNARTFSGEREARRIPASFWITASAAS